MSERIVIHALWAGCTMYCIALIALAIATFHRQPETGEEVAAKLLALFGPLITMVTLLFVRNHRHPESTNGRTAKPG